MTGSLAYRKNEREILAGNPPTKYLRLLPYIPGDRIIEVGSAEGVLALLLAKQGKEVTALERNQERHEAAQRLRDAWGMDVNGPRFICGDILANLGKLEGHDTLLCVRSIYYLGERGVDTLFTAAARYVPNVVLCGNGNRAARWRAGTPDEPLGDMNRYAAHEGMTAILERHCYRIVEEVTEGDEIVVGKRA